MRPIDADALFVSRDWENCVSPAAVIHKAPTLTLDDFRPNGCWNIVEFDKAANRITIECSTCGMVEEMSLTSYALGHNFCHSCGAKMENGEADE